MRSLPRIVAETEVGKDTTVTVWRDGEVKTLEVAVGELKDDKQVASSGGKPKGGERDIDDLGLTLTAITDQVRSRFKLAKDAQGLLVTKVDGDGPAAEKNIRPGDVIVEVSQAEVSTTADVVKKIREVKKAGRETVLLLLEGDSGMRFVVVRLPTG